MNFASKIGIASVGTPILLLLSACATTAPRELIEARDEYRKASSSTTAQLNPAGLHEAKKALDRANLEFDKHPDASSTRDFAYVALRRIQLAEVQADTQLAAQQKAQAERDLQLALQREQQRAQQSQRQQLSQAEQATEQERQRLAHLNQELQRKNEQLEDERRARARSEQQTQKIASRLASIASVREEQRGLVITFPGSVLFQSGRSTLLPTARNKLDQVAEALAKTNQNIVIEGHTDNRGSDRINQGLSERRAETVRGYLLDRGVPPERLTAVGFGKKRPIAGNATAQGRASNRRVEIVVQRPSARTSG